VWNIRRTAIKQRLHLEGKNILFPGNSVLNQPSDLTKYIRRAPKGDPKFFSAKGNVFAVEESGYYAVDQNNIWSLPDHA
jgi:hypothetical protein